MVVRWLSDVVVHPTKLGGGRCRVPAVDLVPGLAGRSAWVAPDPRGPQFFVGTSDLSAAELEAVRSAAAAQGVDFETFDTPARELSSEQHVSFGRWIRTAVGDTEAEYYRRCVKALDLSSDPAELDTKLTRKVARG